MCMHLEVYSVTHWSRWSPPVSGTNTWPSFPQAVPAPSCRSPFAWLLFRRETPTWTRTARHRSLLGQELSSGNNPSLSHSIESSWFLIHEKYWVVFYHQTNHQPTEVLNTAHVWIRFSHQNLLNPFQ